MCAVCAAWLAAYYAACLACCGAVPCCQAEEVLQEVARLNGRPPLQLKNGLSRDGGAAAAEAAEGGGHGGGCVSCDQMRTLVEPEYLSTSLVVW